MQRSISSSALSSNPYPSAASSPAFLKQTLSAALLTEACAFYLTRPRAALSAKNLPCMQLASTTTTVVAGSSAIPTYIYTLPRGAVHPCEEPVFLPSTLFLLHSSRRLPLQKRRLFFGIGLFERLGTLTMPRAIFGDFRRRRRAYKLASE